MIQTARDDGLPVLPSVRALESFGHQLGWGLLVVGIIWESSRAIERIAVGPSSSTAHAGIILEWLAVVLATGLAGRAAAVGSRLVAEIIAERSARESHSFEEFRALATRAVAALERRADLPELRPGAGPESTSPAGDRPRLLAEIDRAILAGRPLDAESLLDGFIAMFPEDPEILDRRQRIDASRGRERENLIAELQAARQVNDHIRVLELYRGVGSWLEDDRRVDLERDLSRWFMELIHRRLRGGRIQPELVELATVVSETFSSTREGASLRASLPTLRRSVGLCPRCAQPYVGMAAACPQCLGGATGSQGEGRVHPGGESEPDPDDPGSEPRDVPRDDRDADWMSYNEDDVDDPVAPA